MKSYSSFTDRRGRTWSIPDLLTSVIPRIHRMASVPELLNPILDEERWGPHVGTVREAIELALEIQRKANKDQLQSPTDSLSSHASRINSILLSLEAGQGVEPIVIGPDNEVWDGIHRLAACHLVGISTVPAIDFSK